MRTIAEAARDVVSGKDETLWHVCREISFSRGFREEHALTDQQACEMAIRSFTNAQLKLYDISSEAEK